MIDYSLIAHSNDFYEGKGFIHIESPWAVSAAVSAITKPDNRPDYVINHNGKSLVASGEQSFLYLYLKGFLPNGRFSTTTPCFRYENFDAMHTKYFIKTELIDTKIVTQASLEEIIQICFDFFSKHLDSKKLSIDSVNGGFDINYDKKYELGSYGIRRCEFLEWIYATGCAEPRLSSVIKMAKNGLS